MRSSSEVIKLPQPRYKSKVSLEQALLKRRSVRRYRQEPLSLEAVAQLLWAAQGISEPKRGLRTAPSAGALYPFQVYLVAGEVIGLKKGVYQYLPLDHSLVLIKKGEIREELMAAALNQSWVREGAIVIVLSAVMERTTTHYGSRGKRYVLMEAGHIAQNVALQAVALGLGTVVVAAFDDDLIKKTLNLDVIEQPLNLMPVGTPKKEDQYKRKFKQEGNF